jgi:hypothetical protein
VSAFNDARHGGLLSRTDLLLRLFCSNGERTAMRPPALHQLKLAGNRLEMAPASACAIPQRSAAQNA